MILERWTRWLRGPKRRARVVLPPRGEIVDLCLSLPGSRLDDGFVACSVHISEIRWEHDATGQCIDIRFVTAPGFEVGRG